MRLLSILDLETATQPISNEEGTIWTVLSGEINSFRALRGQRLFMDDGGAATPSRTVAVVA